MSRTNAIGIIARSGNFLATCLILCSFFGFIFSTELAGQAINESPDVFTIANIHVDVTDKTASAARKKALSRGENTAFNLLLERLTLRIDHKRLPVLNSKQISTYVKDFAVKNEKNSEIRYLADLTFRFKPDDIRKLLRDNDIQFAETISKPILVLPVYQLAGAVFLWDDPNPWREAWIGNVGITKTRKRMRASGLVPMVFGDGDLGDIAAISAELAIKGDAQRLLAIAKKYKVAKTLVIFANLSSTLQGTPVLKIRVSKYGKDTVRHVFSMQIKANKMETIGVLIERSANEVNAKIEELWKSDNLLKFEDIGVVAVSYPINKLGEWVDLKSRLKKVAVIENIELVIFSRSEVRLNIHFIGGVDQLKLALAQLDMKLKEEEGSWVLRDLKPIKSISKENVKTK